jgi:putative hemolysin
MRRASLAVASVMLAVVPLCAAEGPVADLGEGNVSASGIPNPASELCISLDGISRAADLGTWGGSSLGLCRLSDDSIIAEWALFHAVNGDGNQAAEAFVTGQWEPLAGPIETWADQACADAGGQVVEYVEHLRPSSAVRLCEFFDGSSVEVWTMFSGPDFYPELGRVLAPADLVETRFWHCPWPRTCMAPCQMDPPPEVLCKYLNGEVSVTSFACCCCGSGVNSYIPLP